MLTMMAEPTAIIMDVPCCAMELEQEIERLEAEANRDELVSFTLLAGGPTCASQPRKALCTDDTAPRQDQDAHVSDADSDDGAEQEEEEQEAEDAEMARIRANALLVSQCGKTLQPGAWRGCVKSPRCDREDRHRGLCNHKATIFGPAAFPEPPSSEEEEGLEQRQEHQRGGPQQQEQDDDASNLDEGGYEACSNDVVMQSADEQQVSGGHSHNCALLEACTSGDEREVASALHTGDLMECVRPQLSTTQAQLQQQVAAAAAGGSSSMDAPMRSSSTAEEDLFWCGGPNAGQLAAAEIFSIPPAYQPRVKDLAAAPGAPCVLGMDSLCDDISAAPLDAAPAAEEPQVTGGCMSSDCSDHTMGGKPCALSGSVPSSPSCASAGDAAVFGPFQPAPVPAAPARDAANTSTPAAVCDDSHAAATSPSPRQAAAVDTAAAAAAEQAQAQAAEAVAALAAVAPNTPAPSADADMPAAAPLPAVSLTADAAQAALEQAAAQAAAAEAVAAAAAAEAAVVNSTSPSAAAAAAGVAAAGSGLAGVQRPPRIKSKPSASVMKAAAAVEASSAGSSPTKGKKRPAARLAANPSSHHSCSQCGAVSTPVWRAGPAGPKTLCNACGVRYMKVAKRKP